MEAPEHGADLGSALVRTSHRITMAGTCGTRKNHVTQQKSGELGGAGFAVFIITLFQPPFGPAIPLLSLYPKDLKSAYCSDAPTSMFIAAQLTIAKL